MDKKISFIFIGSLAIAAIFLIYEHRVHILGNFQYVFFALFIGLHLLMHLGHGEHSGHTTHSGLKKGGNHG